MVLFVAQKMLIFMKRFSFCPLCFGVVPNKPTFLSGWHCTFFPGLHRGGLDEGHAQGKKARKNDGEGLCHSFPLCVYIVKWLGKWAPDVYEVSPPEVVTLT